MGPYANMPAEIDFSKDAHPRCAMLGPALKLTACLDPDVQADLPTSAEARSIDCP